MKGARQQAQPPVIARTESQGGLAIRHSFLTQFLTNRKEGANHGN
jgi:hypothetical protein